MPRKTLITKGEPTDPSKEPEAKRAKRGKTKPPGEWFGSVRIERVPASKIKPAKYNPRKRLTPADPEYQALKRSLEEFGYVDPLVWNKRSGNLVGGHQRLAILVAEQGLTEVDVSVVDLPPGAEKSLNVALNRITGSWDDIALAKLLCELRADDSVDHTLTGYSDAEIDLLAQEVELAAGEQGPEEPHTTLSHSYKVIAECVSARQQTEIERLLTKRGVAFHVLTRK